jgi:hypothetical protein
MDTWGIEDDQWSYVLDMLPPGLEESAKETSAIVRKRSVRSASDLLRLVMAYGVCGMSLRECAAWAGRRRIARISDVALLKRLRKCGDWLSLLLSRKLAQRARFPQVESERLRLVDATGISCPQSQGTDWRIHLCYDATRGCIDFARLTTSAVGESLVGLEFGSGDVVLCDRGYGYRKNISEVVRSGGDVIVRVNLKQLPLVGPDGSRFDILAAVRTLADGQVGEWAVTTAPSAKDGIGPIPGRLIAMRKSDSDAATAKDKRRKTARRKKEKAAPATLESAEYIILFTTIAAERLSAREVLDVFRFRWQVELVFKRMKSILHLDEMAAQSYELCRTFLLAKLLAALLIDELIGKFGAFSPCGDGSAPSGLGMAAV